MTTRLQLNIAGMECPNCALRLESLEDRLPGVYSAEAGYHKARLPVTIDESRLDEAHLCAGIERLGYQVTGVKKT